MKFDERLSREPVAAAFLVPLLASFDEPHKTSLKHIAAYRYDAPMPTNREELLTAARNAAVWTGIAEDKGNVIQSCPTSAAALYALLELLRDASDAV